MVASTIFLFFGVALVASGVIVLYFRARELGKARLMRSVRTSPAAGVAELPPGTPVEVAGTLRCESPLSGELSGERCAHYSFRVTREYLEHDDRPGSDRRSETLSSGGSSVPFAVEDASGSVRVDPEGAEVDARRVVDRFEKAGAEGGLSVGGLTIRFGGEEQTLGYRYTEDILPPDAPVYVLGEVRADGTIGRPSGEGRFLISHRSEEELGRALARNARLLALVSAGLLLMGLAFAAVGAAGFGGYIAFG